MKLQFKRIKNHQIDQISDIPPEEWKFDIVEFIKTFNHLDNFYFVTAATDNKIVGTGNIFITGKSSWLGNIIVRETYRRNNTGTEITEHLIDYSDKNNCETINLIATDTGKMLYTKSGFIECSKYIFFKEGNVFKNYDDKNISRINVEDLPEIYRIDKSITGDDRKSILGLFYSDGYKYSISDNIVGFYLPSLGNGAIIAEEVIAGIELLKLKHSQPGKVTIAPEQNIVVSDFLKANNYREYARATRMFKGNEPVWKPEGMFCRISGYIS